MKKKITSLLLTLALCLGLLPTTAFASESLDAFIERYSSYWTKDAIILTREEAARDYGISLSIDSIDFGTFYLDEEVEPVTFTVTNNSNYTITNSNWFCVRQDGSSSYGYLFSDDDGSGDSGSLYLSPGESANVRAKFFEKRRGSYHDTVHLWVQLSGDAGSWRRDKLLITDILTVDYEIKDPDKEVPAGDIQWDLSTTTLDLGVSNITKRSNYLSDEYLTGAVTVTNRSSRPMRVESRLDTSGCSWEAIEYIMSADTGEYLRPGESTDIKIRLQRSSWYETGAIEGCKLNLTAYYPDYPESREENTLTASIPITAKFLSDGGHVLYFNNDNVDARAFDAQGNELTLDGRVLVVKEGDTVTFVAVPPDGFYVSELLVDKKNVGAVDHYTFTNIQSSHEIGHHVGRGPAPYTPYVPGQPPVTPTTPVQPPVEPSDELPAWAEGQVKGAISQGLVPQELQGGYNLVTTRAQFCALAVRLYESVKGEITGRETFTDTDDVNVQKMAALGVVSGVGGGAFIPDGPLTREQAATILARLSNAMGKPLSGGSHPFTDGVASWADAAVGQVYQAGIMNGTGNTTFSPQGEYTRMQSIVTIMRLYALVK